MGFTMEFPQDMAEEIAKLANADEICEEMLTAAGPIVEKEMEKAIKSVTIPGKSTGELAESIRAGKPYKKGTLWISTVKPTGYSKTHMIFSWNHSGVKTKRKYKISNSLKLVYHEYGNSRQSARPCLDRAVRSANDETINKMIDIFNRKVGG